MKPSTLLPLLLAFLFIAPPARAQVPSAIMALDANKHHYYEKVFQADGKSKAELYKATKAWIVKNIKVQAIAHYFDDTGMSAISTNPVIVVNGSTVDFKLNIDFKDGRYKLSANAFVLHNSYGVS